MSIENELQNLEGVLASLPGLGPKTVKRLALHLITKPEKELDIFLEGISAACRNIKICQCCGNLATEKLCRDCCNPLTEDSFICLVESLEDMLSLKHGLPAACVFHILGGKLSPLHGVSPEDLNIDSLMKRLEVSVKPKEVILALGADVEGEATASYIANLLKEKDINVTRIAFGLSVGSSLSRSNEKSIQKSIAARTSY